MIHKIRRELASWQMPTPMVVLIALSGPSALFLAFGQEKTYAENVSVLSCSPAQFDDDHSLELVVDSIFRSIRSQKPIFAAKSSNSKFGEWMYYLKAREGYVPKPYRCPAGYQTVGYGHNISAHGWSKAQKYMRRGQITYEGATQLLYSDVEEEIRKVTSLAPHLSRNQTLAIAGLFANCGSGKIVGKSKFWKDVMSGRTPDFSPYCRYKKPTKGGRHVIVTAANLIAARSFEQSLFEGGNKPVKIQRGKKLIEVSFEEAAKHYQSCVASRDIASAKKHGTYN